MSWQKRTCLGYLTGILVGLHSLSLPSRSFDRVQTIQTCPIESGSLSRLRLFIVALDQSAFIHLMSHRIDLVKINDVLDLLSCIIEDAALVMVVGHLRLMPSLRKLRV